MQLALTTGAQTIVVGILQPYVTSPHQIGLAIATVRDTALVFGCRGLTLISRPTTVYFNCDFNHWSQQMTQVGTPLDNPLDLSGRIAIVTGASGGIGTAIARHLALAGAQVAVHFYHNHKQALATAESIDRAGSKAAAIGADLRTEAGCRALLEQTGKSLGQPTILVNTAGIQPVSDLLQLCDAQTADVFQTNLNAPVLLSRLFAQQHIDSGQVGKADCCITNIASIEGLQPAAGHSHYASSKAALIMFTRAAAHELGAQGIRVNAVSPGLIDRPELTRDWPDGVQRYQSAAALGRIGDSADIANAVLFLSSAAASWITGSNLVVDGGVSCAPTW